MNKIFVNPLVTKRIKKLINFSEYNIHEDILSSNKTLIHLNSFATFMTLKQVFNYYNCSFILKDKRESNLNEILVSNDNILYLNFTNEQFRL